jgi:hypothetical protein
MLECALDIRVQTILGARAEHVRAKAGDHSY